VKPELVAPFALLLAACGARSSLDVGRDGGAPTATPTDAGRPPTGRDAGRPPVGVDAGPPPPPGDCELGMVFDIVEGPGTFERPALARGEGRDAMLVFTDSIGGDETTMWALPITPNGNPRGGRVFIGEGEGGTVVPYTLAWSEPGFTTAYRGRDGLDSARMDPLAERVLTSSEPAPIDRVRPLVVLGERFSVRGWTAAGDGTGQLDLGVGSPGIELDFSGVDMVGALGPGPDRFRVASHDGSQGYIEEYDGMGRLVGTEVLGLPPSMFPVGTGGVHVVDNHPDAVVLWGGTIRALFDGILWARLEGAEADWFIADTNLFHTDAAYDDQTGWLGMASAVGVGEGRILFHGLHASGATSELVLAEGLPLDSAPDPAILDVGPGEPSFLVVWPIPTFDGSLRGAHVRCGP